MQLTEPAGTHGLLNRGTDLWQRHGPSQWIGLPKPRKVNEDPAVGIQVHRVSCREHRRPGIPAHSNAVEKEHISVIAVLRTEYTDRPKARGDQLRDQAELAWIIDNWKWRVCLHYHLACASPTGGTQVTSLSQVWDVHGGDGLTLGLPPRVRPLGSLGTRDRQLSVQGAESGKTHLHVTALHSARSGINVWKDGPWR